MISKVKLSTGLLLVALTQSHAYADISVNGLPLNGLQLNGLELNGLPLNGLNINGLPLNGLNYNGARLNGLDLNGMKTLNNVETSVESVTVNPLVSLADESLAK
ncbi:MAG: hypothetical protein B0W54_00435 [Cellvibrio sp. 79]|nr:MAG: hypothetical protein B0W54_00435 [Cellvibrio sp. 79]